MKTNQKFILVTVIIILILLLSEILINSPIIEEPIESINEMDNDIERSNSIDLEKPPFLENNNN